MNDIHTVSQEFTFILYADDTTLISPLSSFIHSSQSDVDYVSTMINMELSKISDWLAVNKRSLNTAKTKFMLLHNYYFAAMFRYNREFYDIQTRDHELLPLYPVRTSNAWNALIYRIPELLCKYQTAVLEKARTHSIMSFTSHVKFHLLDSYCSDCLIPQCYICSRLT